MSIKCILGYHNWTNNCEKCIQCGTTRASAHAWNGCKCSTCGQARDKNHNWLSDCEKCATCGKTRTGAHTWSGRKCLKCLQTPPSDEKIFNAAKSGNTAEVQMLLAKGANPNAKGIFGWTALIGASGNGHLNVVQLLLENGAEIDAKDDNGYTALMSACLSQHAKVVRLLLDRGADVNAKVSGGTTTGGTPLTMGTGIGRPEVIRELVQALLEKGADVNAKRNDGFTALMAASSLGFRELVQALLAKGADVNAKSNDGKTALDYATTSKNAEASALAEVRALLVQAGDPSITQSNRTLQATVLETPTPQKSTTTPTAVAPKPSPQPVSPPRTDQTPKPQPASEASHIQAENGDGWFFAEDKSRGLRQVVFTFRGDRTTPSQFESTFTFPGEFKQLFYDKSPFATGFFRTDRDPGPFLLVRSWGTFPSGVEMIDSFTEFSVAITFIQMPTSGLVVVFVTSDSLQKYTQSGYLECFYGLDKAYTRDLLADVIRRDGLYATLDGDSGFKYDVKICMDDACRHVLTREWDRILTYHGGIQLPDYNKATQSAFSLFKKTTKMDPILSSSMGT